MLTRSLEMARQVIALEADALHAMATRIGDSFAAAIAILQATVEQHRKIVVIGVGKSGNIAQKIAATFNSTGAPALVLDPQNALHGDLGVLTNGDAVLLLSASGETPELLLLLPHLQQISATRIALTGKLQSQLAKQCDIALDTSVEREACPLNLAPTSSSTAMLVMGDALAMSLLDARGFTAQDFARYHPGGSLGRALLTKVSDIMRSGSALARLPLHASVSDALLAMKQARSGACVIIQADGRLAGVFTHGDFVRAFLHDPLLGSQPVSNFMTTQPVTVPAAALAAQAIRTIGDHRIDDIVVLDAANQPVGLIDTQDLARIRL